MMWWAVAGAVAGLPADMADCPTKSITTLAAEAGAGVDDGWWWYCW